MSNEIVEVKNQEVVMPNVELTVKAIRAFQELKAQVLDANDTVLISGKPYIKRSGWRKIALAFNVQTEITHIERESFENGIIVRIRAKATAPNGRTAEEAAVCDSSEFKDKAMTGTLHNIETKAATRAINRAISDLVGGGEVSAEEMASDANREPGPITDKQKKLIQGMAVRGDEKGDYIDFMLDSFKKKTPDLTKAEANQIISAVVNEDNWKKARDDADFRKWIDNGRQ